MFLEFLIRMVTIGKGNPVSPFTVPVMVLDCEKTIMGKKTNKKNILFIIFNFLIFFD